MKRLLLLVMISTIILGFIPFHENAVKASDFEIPHYNDGINVNDQFLVFKSSFPTVQPPEYFYQGTWRVQIRDNVGHMIDNNAGNMGFIRPTDKNEDYFSKGRTFAHKSAVSRWIEAFGGNVEWATQKDRSGNFINIIPSYFTRATDNQKFERYHSVELGRVSGAVVTPMKDSNGVDYLDVQQTKWPTIQKFSVPSKVENGKTFSVYFDATTDYPYNPAMLTYELRDNGTVIKNGIKRLDNNNQKVSNVSIPVTLKDNQTHKLELTVYDTVHRYTKKTVTISNTGESTGEPEKQPNKPPIANIYADPEFYWVQTATWKDSSYDLDGKIDSTNFFLDGSPVEGTSYKFSRVTQPEVHTVSVEVTDNSGDSATANTTFKILPTTPTAGLLVGGTLKVNRKIELDATPSNNLSPVSVAPIDYSKTKWTITPITEGIDPSGIKIRASSDKSKQEMLVKQSGDYNVTVTVTNVYGEESKPFTKKITVVPDEKPVAQFTVSSGKELRNKDDGDNASIALKDQSFSPDGDKIKQRIYYVEYDANNDGVFGTVEDGGKKVISSDNETEVTFKTTKLGHYRFSMEVKEDFGQPTLMEFINDDDYLKDSSEVIDPQGRVSEYTKPENFNIPSYDKYVEVDNAAPVIDFGMKRQNSIDLIMNFGGMDTATKQHKTGSRPGLGTNNGGGGGTYDNYYYSIDDTIKNMLTSYASNLEADFKAKGIDAHVVIDNSYYHVFDSDGECVTNIPRWGYVDHGYYEYSSYSGTSPYSGSWEVVSQSSTPIMGVTWCYEDTTASGGKVNEHPPPCDKASNEIWGQIGTQYNASIRHYVSNYQFEIVGNDNEGCIDQEKVDTTDFTDSYENQTYRSNADKLFFRMDNKQWTWGLDPIKMNQFIDKTKLENIFFWNNGDSSNKNFTEKIVSEGSNKGQYTMYDTEHLQSNIQKVKDYVINKYMIEENKESFTIVLGDKVDYTTAYTDFENDPEFKREWKFTHDPTQVNGRTIDNQPSAPIPQSGLFVDSPVDLNEVGTYKVILHAMDDPIKDGDSRFANYRKWSDEDVVREYVINVHRRPIADFTYQIEPGTLKLTLHTSQSYDPDHRFNRVDRGIVEYTWGKYVVDGKEYQGAPPYMLEPGKDYSVTLRVKDIDGAYGTVTKLISTRAVNLKPIALFDVPSTVLDTQPLNILDKSYDPNGDPLTEYQVTIRKSNSSTILKTLNGFPKSFSDIGLGQGQYTIGLTVKDIPKYPPQLQSDLYEKQITVVHNDPPISQFSLSPEPIIINKKATYTDSSYDPNGDQLINYSWKIEKLSATNQVIKTWNTGSKPIDFSEYGIGKFRVTQTVFDNPPSPLPSLKGESSIIVNVIQGPQNPYANFSYSPLIPIEGQNISLDPDSSVDPDGTVVAWNWTIKAPNGSTTTSTAHYPSITNAQKGDYTVTLNVKDNDGLSSLEPSVQTITVKPKPPNQPPVAVFAWDPGKPFLGEDIKMNPDSSYDFDGDIVSYQWTFKAKDGTVQTSVQKYPTITAGSDYYDVTLVVTDDQGATASITSRINVNIAKLDGIVTHSPEWGNRWVSKGEDKDVNKFYAGEQFVIKLKSTPAAYVWGSVDFGGKIGKIDIPKETFKLVSTSKYEYEWEATLWQPDFKDIPNGGYLFNFHSFHPVNSPYIQADSDYIINIVGSIYDTFQFHRKY